ncbi:acetyl-CoA carboxylase family protein [Rhodopila sp.]|uniref:acetyl-CoA carboxylase family protein n=1 Tax=Rhodopila sp. TaxID=2480087 RepID=UPI002C9BDA37|nr:carboxyl transferase domain-containing protein [Rhodopila sp.]HVZ06293.1 carboxyl transferase domain-containing protein [Rhodopila sp.]
MAVSRLLIANRGEIAIRIARAAADMGLHSVAVFSQDDTQSLHPRMAEQAVPLPGQGAAAYLDIDAVIGAAREAGCDAVHPGYGFLAERADLAARCAAEGLTFVGPDVAHLELFGDKARARAAAIAARVPVIKGLDHAVSLEEARAFFDSLGPGGAMIIKAVAGGGGRGTRAVLMAEDIAEAYQRCQSEARAAFGRPDVYVEAFLPRARHVEVQILGDAAGHVTHLGERECSVQRRFQKILEVAPAPALHEGLRADIIGAAVRFAQRVGYRNLGTFEFLVDAAGHDVDEPFVFIETNARLQVEHTVTEAVTGVDLVQTQIRLAQGASLAELGLATAPIPRGYAIQARVNMETVSADGSVRPSGGTLTAYEPPSGPGVRVDGFGYTGYRTSRAFDSLLAKVIVQTPSSDFAAVAAKASRALGEFRLDGVATSIPFLRAILAHRDFAAGAVHTRWIDEHVADLVAMAADQQPRFVEPARSGSDAGFAGARVRSRDPLALFAHDAQVKAQQAATASDDDDAPELTGPDGSVGVPSPIQGTIVAVDVKTGDAVRQGQRIAVVEAMKMEHLITAPHSGIVRDVTMAPGDVVREGFPIAFVLEADVEGGAVITDTTADLDHIRDDLREVYDRHALTLDENRPDAVARRRKTGYRMPRENIEQLVDPGSFKEYWPLIVALQHQRNSIEALRKNTPADGVVAGTCSINGDLFDETRSRALVVHYDYTVLAGTQGRRNHYKQDRMFELAHRFRLPLVLFGEGGGGRPGDDTVGPRVAVDTHTFTTFSQLSGLVPLVAIVNGRTFAGNTALVACSDVIIATAGSTLGMGGPAMIEGGGLGIYTPEEVGPMSVQVPNGVVDVLVKDEAEAVEVARKYLSYFQGRVAAWETPDQRALRHVIPENRLRLYNMREIIETIADKGSVLELRPRFGVGIITAFIRVEGRPMGVIANNPHHLAGAIDSNGSDKGARFLQLCDAFDIPVLSLVDCPGIMVGPEVERTALVRHCTRLFNVGANMTAPLFTVIVRKAYGLGAQAMCGAGTLVGFFAVAWPTAEFAGMNIEGAVKLGYRKELMGIEDPEDRRAEFERRTAAAYDAAKAVNAAQGGGIDDVIDPADTRDWIASSLKRLPPVPPRTSKKYPYIDPW